MKTINELNKQILDCNLCSNINPITREKVLGIGPVKGIMIVGEAPAFNEILQQKPFVGEAGKILREVISNHLTISDEDVRITNTCRCHPVDTKTRKTRTPKTKEIQNCKPFLDVEIDLVNPELIILVGKIPFFALFGNSSARIKDYRQKCLIYKGYRTFVTYHPGAILRNRNLKSDLEKDFEFFRSFLKGGIAS